jgi:hypothetical protein
VDSSPGKWQATAVQDYALAALRLAGTCVATTRREGPVAVPARIAAR